MKRMLINATQPEEIRVALVDGQKIYDLDIDNISKEQKKANIYLGTVRNLEPSLNAAFIDYGSERHGFLPVKEIAREYWQDPASAEDGNHDESDSRSFNRRPNIKDILKVGQPILVQVDKEERGNKGAALTTFISLAGCYLVLMPNNPRAGGISRRIDGDERDDMREILNALNIPESMGVIVRTAGVGRAETELQWDLSVLLKRWEDILKAVEQLSPPALIHQERDLIARAVRDHLREDIGEIIIDNDEFYEKTKQYVERLRPDMLSRVKHYTDKVPLFSRFQIESQIESAFQREVVLPSGGSVCIDPTEALISIDINSARATKGSDIEETALQTNLEAADEIARQLRLRDIGGLIVIDFIDMTPPAHQRDVENRLREALRLDRARVQVGRISRFGLLEMSRQRLRSSLGETIHEPCPRCNGQGTIRGIESLSLSIIRLIEEESMKDKTVEIHAALPIEVATFLTNEKRSMLIELEKRHGVRVVIMPVMEIQAPAYEIRRVRVEEEATMAETSSYQKAKEIANKVVEQTTEVAAPRVVETPAVEYLPTHARAPEPSAIGKGISSLIKFFKPLFTTPEPEKSRENNRRGGGGRHDHGHRRSGSGSGQDRGRSRHGRRRGGSEDRERTDRNENTDRNQRTDRNENTDRNQRADRNENTDRNQRTDRNDNRRQNQPRHQSHDNPERTSPVAERNDRPEQQRTDRPERQERGERNERGGRGRGRGGRDNRDGQRQSRRPSGEGNQEHRSHQQEMSPVIDQVHHHETPVMTAHTPVVETPRPAVVEQAPAPVMESRPAPAPVVQQFTSPLMQETPLVDVTAANAAHSERSQERPERSERQDRPQQRRRANHLRPYAGNKQDNRENRDPKPEPTDSEGSSQE